jgi:hypothetical protein
MNLYQARDGSLWERPDTARRRNLLTEEIEEARRRRRYQEGIKATQAQLHAEARKQATIINL